MPLDNERIKELLALKNKPRGGGGSGSRTKKKYDPNDRSYQAWFAMNHMLLDQDTNEMLYCDNPDCIDPRDKTYGQTVVTLDSKNMCRFCFIEGWLAVHKDQQVIS